MPNEVDAAHVWCYPLALKSTEIMGIETACQRKNIRLFESLLPTLGEFFCGWPRVGRIGMLRAKCRPCMSGAKAKSKGEMCGVFV